MQLVHPYYLLGLLAVGIPVLIHLFNFRRYKRVFFPNVNFIKDIQIQTQKQSRLKHLIILALRILAITALVTGFAQPFLPLSVQTANIESGNAVSIYLDNSFSMEAHSGYGQMLEEGRKKAAEIAAAYKASDQYQLLTNDFEGIHQRFVTRDEFLELLGQEIISPVSRNLSEVVTRQKDLMHQQASKNKILYLISDFQKNTMDLASIPEDTNIRIVLIPLKANPFPNISIDSCWFASPVHQAGKSVRIKARVRNLSDQAYEKVPLKLLINKNQKAVSSFSLPPGGAEEIEMTYTDLEPGIRFGQLEIADNPIVYDDVLYFSYNVAANIPVLVIDRGNPNIYLSSLMKNDSAFRYTRQAEQNLDYSSFGDYSLIILDGLPEISSGLAQELNRFVVNGGSLLVTPSEDMNLGSYRNFLQPSGVSSFGPIKKTKQKINRLALQHPVFQEVFDAIPENIDLPVVTSSFELGGNVHSNRDVLMNLQDGSPYLTVQPVNKGRVYLLASPLDPSAGNFPQHALFVPVIYKIALLSRPDTRLYYTIGNNQRIEFNPTSSGGDQVVKIRKTEGDFEFIPGQAQSGPGGGLLADDQVRDAGHYQVVEGDQVKAGLAFNYKREESEPAVYTPSELKEYCAKAGLKNVSILDNNAKSLTETVQEMNAGIRLWKIFIILALVFLASEVVLLRFWK